MDEFRQWLINEIKSNKTTWQKDSSNSAYDKMVEAETILDKYDEIKHKEEQRILADRNDRIDMQEFEDRISPPIDDSPGE